MIEDEDMDKKLIIKFLFSQEKYNKCVSVLGYVGVCMGVWESLLCVCPWENCI